MKITHLIKESNAPLYERVAKQIPRGIQSHNEVCKVGYKLAVQEVGIKEAQQLDTKFAAKLMSSYYQQHINEGVGSFLGKAAGHVVGGLGAAWRDAKQGYKDAKSSWGGGAPAPAPTTAPATSTPVSTASASTPVSTTSAGQTAPASTATPPAGNKPAPAAATGDLDSIMQQVQGLDATQKKALLDKLQSGEEAPAEPEATTPATTPATDPTQSADATARGQQNKGFGFNNQTGMAFNSQEEKDAFKAQQAQAGSAPAPTGTTPPAPTAPATTTPPAGGKMTPAQQAALKAKLQGQRQAGKTTATQTGSGFKDYVGGSQEKMTGVDASGAPIFKKLQRESVIYSNFLGKMI